MRIQRVGDYLLGEKLGEGSFAKVRVGLHVLSREKVRHNLYFMFKDIFSKFRLTMNDQKIIGAQPRLVNILTNKIRRIPGVFARLQFLLR